MHIEDALRLHYDTIAKEYDGVDQGLGRILSRLNIPSESSILDIGCGTGNLTLRLMERGSPQRVVGIDLSVGVLSIAREHAQDAHLGNFEFLCASACSLPFDVEEFDVVVSNMVLHLVSNKRKALSEIVRVLKPSGRAVLQLMGGGDVSSEMMEIRRNVWNEVLPEKDTPDLLYRVAIEDRVTVEMMGKYLTDLGVYPFEITWRRNVVRIEESDLPDFLKFFRLVGGFWQQAVGKEVAERIDNLITKRVQDHVVSGEYISHTGNSLLVEITKP